MAAMPLAAPVIAVDLGGTKVAVGVVLPEGRLAARVQEPTSRHGPAAVVDQIARLARAAVASAAPRTPGLDLRACAGVAVACPGPVDPARGIVHSPPNLPGWGDEPVRDRVAEALDLPARVANDADCAALGEWAFGAGRGTRHLVYVTVSTGVGGGLVLDGRLWMGTVSAGEIGHLQVDPDGPLCGCGRRGCLEALASGPAIAWRYAALRGEQGPADAASVFASARAGDPAAAQAIDEAGRALGRTLGGLVNVLAPERIVLGGGVALGGHDLLLPPLLRALDEAAFPLPRGRVDVRLAECGADAGLLGAAMLFADTR